MEVSRRGLITGLATLLAAPAIVRVASIMPVKALRPEGAPYWREWLAALKKQSGVGGFIPYRTIFLTPWQIENLAKPAGLIRGVDYLPYAEISQAAIAAA